MLFNENSKHGIFNAILIALDIACIVCAMMEGTGPIKNIDIEGVKTSLLDEIKNMGESNWELMVVQICKEVQNVTVAKWGTRNLYISAIVGGVFYIIAALVEIIKNFYGFPFMESMKWLICIVLRVIIFGIGILGTAGVYCFYGKYYECGTKDVEVPDIEPYKTMKGFLPEFICFMIFGFLGLIVDILISIQFRKK